MGGAELTAQGYTAASPTRCRAELPAALSVEWEFGARLESMRVEEARTGNELPPERFSPPPAADGAPVDAE